MWIKTEQGLYNLNMTERLKIVSTTIAMVKDNLINICSYSTTDDCKFVLSLIAKALEEEKDVFYLPTQEQVTKRELPGDKTIKAEKASDVPADSVKRALEMWNGLEEYGFKPVSRITPSSQRYKSLMARVREYTIDGYAKAIENVKKSSYLRKNADSWFNFDWFVKPNNFLKVLDGNYLSPEDRIDKEEVNWWET